MTSLYQSFLGVLRRTSFRLKPPVEAMEGLWSQAEEDYVRSRFRLSARGGPEKIRSELLKMAEITDADELIVTSGIFDQKKRFRSFEIISQVLTA